MRAGAGARSEVKQKTSHTANFLTKISLEGSRWFTAHSSVRTFLTSAFFGWTEFPPRSSIEDRIREVLRSWGVCVNKSQFNCVHGSPRGERNFLGSPGSATV